MSDPDSDEPHPLQAAGTGACTRSGCAVRRSVSPLWPGCPPGLRPDRPRRLRVRRVALGFLSPSLDGGLPRLRLLSPRRRSNPSIRPRSQAFSAARRASFCSAVSVEGTGSDSESSISCFSHTQKLVPTPSTFYDNLGSYTKESISAFREPRVLATNRTVRLFSKLQARVSFIGRQSPTVRQKMR